MWANHAEIAAAREMERAQAAFEEGDEVDPILVSRGL